jgi:hypothetical protein
MVVQRHLDTIRVRDRRGAVRDAGQRLASTTQ